MDKNIDTGMKSLWSSIPLEKSASDDVSVNKAFSEFTRRAAGGRRGFGWWSLRIAAALFLPCAIWGAYSSVNRNEKESLLADIGWNQMEVRHGEVKNIVLPDGTEVTMGPGSRIVYPSEFVYAKRQVFFSGEGYFEVKSDERHPFVIGTDDAEVEVVGTKFNLRAFPTDASLELALYEGKVKFSYTNSLGQETEHSVLPGELIEFAHEDASLKSTFFSGREYSSWIDGDFVFRSKPLKEISSQLERIYDVRFVIRNDGLAEIPYYLAVSKGQRIDDVISLLELDSRLRVRRTADIIEIY